MDCVEYVLVSSVVLFLLVGGASAVTFVINDGYASLSLAATPDEEVAVSLVAAKEPAGYSATMTADDQSGDAVTQESSVWDADFVFSGSWAISPDGESSYTISKTGKGSAQTSQETRASRNCFRKSEPDYCRIPGRCLGRFNRWRELCQVGAGFNGFSSPSSGNLTLHQVTNDQQWTDILNDANAYQIGTVPTHNPTPGSAWTWAEGGTSSGRFACVTTQAGLATITVYSSVLCNDAYSLAYEDKTRSVFSPPSTTIAYATNGIGASLKTLPRAPT